MKRQTGTWHRKTPKAFLEGKWHYEMEDVTVNVLAVVGQWAMIGRPRSVPFVVNIKQLTTKP